jgi:hypothetical protein
VRPNIGAAAVALVAFAGGALATSYFSSPSSSVSASQPVAAPAPAVMPDTTAPLGTTALAPVAVPTVQYITEPAPAPVTRTVTRRAPTRRVYRASSASTDSSSSTVSSAQREPRLVRKTRSTKGSVLIIGGSTVGGAGIGAIVGGKKGAVIGGLIGGAAGTVYDRTTRHKDTYE